jgi:hypothetical protein
VTAGTQRWLAAAGVFAAMAALAAMLQSRLGGGTREFTGDDAGHYFTMIVLRGLLLSGQVLAPVRYIVGYFEHYQILGLGLWPPAYHMLGAAWTAAFGVSRASVMALQAGLGAALAAAAVLAGWRPLGPLLAVVAGVGVLLSPLVLAGLPQLQADLPTALAMFLAALAFWRLLHHGRLGDGLLFGAAALVAIMTKGNAIALALLPPAAVLLSGRWRLLRRAGFWMPAAVILPVAGPWYALTYSWSSAGFRYSFGAAYTALAAPFIAQQFLQVFGPVLLILAAVAIAGLVRRRGDDLFTAVMLALVLAMLVFQAVVPAALEPRYLLPTVAPVLLLAARGASGLAEALAPRLASPGLQRLAAPAAVTVAVLLPLLAAAPWAPAAGVGARALADEVLRRLPASDPVLLVASDAPGEGSLSVELAMHEGPMPRVTAARGSRLLGGGGYNNFEYLPRFSSPEEAMALVERLRIPLIVLDRTPSAVAWAHVGQLAAMLERPGAGWDRVSQVVADGRTWDLFRRRTPGEASDRTALAVMLRPNKGPKAD